MYLKHLLQVAYRDIDPLWNCNLLLHWYQEPAGFLLYDLFKIPSSFLSFDVSEPRSSSTGLLPDPERTTIDKEIRRILFVLAIYFSLVIILLSSKAGIFSLLFLFLIITMYLLVITKQIWKGLLFFFLVAVTFYAGYKFLPSTAARFKRAESVLSEQKKSSPETMESNSERLVVWKAGIEVIKENPVFGVGTGDVKDALLSEYQEGK